MEDKIIPLQFDKNGNLKYWIHTNDVLWGFSLWRYESKKESRCSKLITDIPKRFLKHFNNIILTEKYRNEIAETISKNLCN